MWIYIQCNLVILFNDGMYSPIKIFENTGVPSRKYTRSALCKIGNIKIYKEELKVQMLSKEAPKKLKETTKSNSRLQRCLKMNIA